MSARTCAPDQVQSTPDKLPKAAPDKVPKGAPDDAPDNAPENAPDKLTSQIKKKNYRANLRAHYRTPLLTHRRAPPGEPPNAPANSRPLGDDNGRLPMAHTSRTCLVQLFRPNSETIPVFTGKTANLNEKHIFEILCCVFLQFNFEACLNFSGLPAGGL
jgi:hypothetical protein